MEIWETVKLGDLNSAIGDYSTAINYYKQLDDKGDLAQTFALNKQFDSAKKYFSLVIPDTSDQRGLRFYLAFAGEYYSLLNNYNKALPNLLRSLNYHKQYKDVNQIMRVLIDISQTYFALQNHDSAFKYAQEALAVARQTGAKQVLRDASKIVSSVYDYWHRPDSAYFYYKQYTTINDSLVNNKVKGKLAAYGFEQKIELLNKEKKFSRCYCKNRCCKNIFSLPALLFFYL
jgi:tetratricopeptide (TPR) repeat protein